MKKALVVLLILCATAFSQDKKSDFGFGTMTANAGLSFSGFGFGYGATFEFGLTEKFGAQAGVTLNSWENGSVKWSITPIDLWGTYHTATPIGFGDAGYYMAGVSFVTFSVEDGNNEESESAVLFGLGYGATQKINDSLDLYFEARYRLGTLEAGAYKAVVTWYSVGAGISYSL
jgi:hypothetical protein